MRDTLISRIKDEMFTGVRQFAVSILYYSQPFGKGGFLVVFRDDVESFIDLVSKAYLSTPPSMSLHCVRYKELFELSMPAHTTIGRIYESLHLPFWLKNNSLVVHGDDIRREIDVSTDPRLLLDAHVEVCTHYLRNHTILDLLMRNLHTRLIKELDQQIKYLMATMLLMHQESCVEAETIPSRFEHLCTDNQLKNIRSEFNDIVRRIDATHATDAGTQKQSALEAVWLFERFIRSLRDYKG